MKKNRTSHESSLWILRRKTFLTMKFTLFLLLCSLLQVHAEVFSQRRVSIQMREVTLDKVFRELSRQVNCDFLFNHSVVKQKGNVSVNVKDQELNRLLDELLPQLGMEYVVDENVIIVREKIGLEQQNKEIVVRGTVRDNKGEVLPGATVRIKGTNVGVVTTATGEFVLSLPKIADITLVFSFVGMKLSEVRYVGQAEINVVLYEEISEIGEVVVTGFQTIDKRSLTSAISTVKREDLDKMGALTVDQMLEGKVPGLMITNLSAQPGAASKIRIRSGGTFTGSREPLWVIDGIIYDDPVPLSASEINSLDNVNLIGNAITGLNPQDIESINILKDASATAIYGTRAANGVIVVNTRRGKSGSSTVSYSGSYNVVDRPRYSDFNLMNSKERIDVSREIYQNGLGYSSSDGLITPMAYEKALQTYWQDGNYKQFQTEVGRLETLNYDWFKQLYRLAQNQSHSVNVSGGSDKIRYYFSLGYDKQAGTEKNVGLDRVTSRANIDVNFRKNVLLSFGLDGSVQKAKYNHSSVNVFNEAYYKSRAVKATDPEGNLVYEERMIVNHEDYVRPLKEYAKYNILNEMNNSQKKINNKAFNFNVSLDWNIVKGIKIFSRVSYRATDNTTEEWIKENTYYMAALRGYDEYRNNIDEDLIKNYSYVPFGGIFSTGEISQEAISIRNQLNLLKVLNEKHVFNLNVTQEASTTKHKGTSGWQVPGYNHDQGRDFISLPGYKGGGVLTTGVDKYLYPSALKWMTGGGGGGHSVYPTITEKLNNMLSYVGIFTYSYSDRYVLNFNLRSEGSNAFGQYERYKFRPSWSTSLRWNLHKESFVNYDAINELALRASYGFRGASPSATPYLMLSDYGRKHTAYGLENTSSIAGFPNGNLRWEKTATLNLGIDFSLFDNRINGSFDYAYSKSTDLLLSRPVSLVNGMSSEQYNGGAKNDHTYEFNVTGQIIKAKGFRWNVNLNITKVKENITKGTNVIPGQINISDYLDGSIMAENFPIDGFFSYRFGGLNDKGFPTFPELYKSYDSEYEKLKNVLVYEGNRLPIVYGGFGTEIGYKGFALSANFSYKAGQKVRLLELYGNRQHLPLSGENLRSEFVNRWRNAGDEAYTNIPVLSPDPLIIRAGVADGDLPPVGEGFLPNGRAASSLWKLYDLSDLRTVKGDFIRWQSLTLSYSCPDDFLKFIGMYSLSLRFQIQNVAVWAFDKKLKGQDPEQVQNIGMPTLPSYNIGLSFSF